jgi:hypothetical protein
MLVGASALSIFFTKHTSPTSCFSHGYSKNIITSSGNGANYAISWIDIQRTVFCSIFFKIELEWWNLMFHQPDCPCVNFSKSSQMSIVGSRWWI